MGELFDKVLKSDESLFLNSQFLDYDYCNLLNTLTNLTLLFVFIM